MSMNIPRAILDIAVSHRATLEIDLTKLTKRLITNLIRYTKTGVTYGNAPVAYLARSIRRQHELPTVKQGPYSALHWDNVPLTHEFHERKLAHIVAKNLDGFSWYSSDNIDAANKETGSMYGAYKTQLVLNDLDFGSTPELDAYLTDIQNGTVTTAKLILSGSNLWQQ